MPISKQGAKDVSSLIFPEGVLYELGSGWGHLLFALSGKYPDRQIIGYETSLIPYIVSKVWMFCSFRKNVKIFRKDFRKAPLKNAGAIVCYLYPQGMGKLKKQLESSLASGTVVASHVFAIPDWKPLQVINVKDLYFSKIYVYVT